LKKVSFFTLGCRVNTYETQAMCDIFKKNGYEIADFNEICDVYVVNSCTVTAMGDKKSRQELRKAKRKNKDAICALVGCYAQNLIQKGEAFEEADIILGNGFKDKIIDAVEKALQERKQQILVEDALKQRTYSGEKIESFDDKTRAMIKIQDGCDRFCSYCIIPYVRGPVKSRKLSDIKEEVERISACGFKEIVLTGIQVAAFGQDTKEGSLCDVVEMCAEIDGIERIRLGSVEPVIITDEFLTRVKNTGKFCPSFHISLQSGCDETLKRMNRRYTSEKYFEAVLKIREYFPFAGITTDVIVGFPGETEEEFDKSLAFAEKVGFTHIHVFPYSIREGTKAATMEGQIEKSIKDIRVKLMNDVGEKSHKEFLEKLKGETFKVLVEREKEKGVYVGYTENYIEVEIKSEKNITEEIVDYAF
jgi:threonylcarbamoyladenosine tRNA methylthiotransferase MtaB